MRLISWNCNGAFRRKFEHIDTLSPDILVIQECENPAQSTSDYREWADNHFWVGQDKNKGLGVFAPRNHTIELLDWPQGDGGLFLPVRFNNDIDLIAVWTLERKAPFKYSYIGQFWHYMNLNRSRIGSDTVICGDFNSNKIWDKKRREGNHSDCVHALSKLGLDSLYHFSTGDLQGQERLPTFFLHRHLTKPYHIDHVFAHRERLIGGWAGVTIGPEDVWLEHSDHMPIIIDL